MKKSVKMLVKILLYIWQLPQNIAGLIMSGLWKKRLITLPKKELKYLYGLEKLTGCKIYVADYYSHKKDKMLGKISGGCFGIYVCVNSMHDLKTIRHEKDGHGKQSKYLGPGYLLVIGFPSASGNLLARKFEWWHKNYYNLPWEYWADKLAGIKRN